MVFAFDDNHLNGFLEQAQGSVHLIAFDGGDIGILGTVEEQEGSVDFMGGEEGALFGKFFWMAPRVLCGSRDGAVEVSPIAAAPIAGDIADASVADGGSKEACFGDKVHGGKAAVACADTADAFGIDEGMGFEKVLCGLDDLMGYASPPFVDVAGGKALSEADGTAGLEDIDEITVCSPKMEGIATVKVAGDGVGAAVVIDDQGVAFSRIEARGEVDQAVASFVGRDLNVPALGSTEGELVKEALFGGVEEMVFL